MPSFRPNRLLAQLGVLLFFTSSAFAQTLVPPDNLADTTSRFPITSWYDFNRSLILFTRSELGYSNQRIDSLAFFVEQVGQGVKSCQVTIRLKAVSETELVPQAFPGPGSGAIQVFQGVLPGDSVKAGRWLKIPLQIPYDDTGNQNLLIVVESNKTLEGNEGSDFSRRYRCSATPAARFQNWWSDDIQPSGNGQLLSDRPHIRLSLRSIPAPCTGQPQAGTITASTFNLPCPGQSLTLALTGYEAANNIAFQWQRRNPAGTWLDVPSATVPELTARIPGTVRYRCRVTCIPSTQSSFSPEQEIAVAALPQNLPFSTGFSEFVQSEGQSFPLSCQLIREEISGPRGWRATLGKSTEPRMRGVVGRTDSAAIYSGWGTLDAFHLPSLNMSSDSLYTLSFYYKHSRPGDNNEGPGLQVRVGPLPENDLHTTQLLSLANQNDTVFKEAVAEFHPDQSGVYNFSIRNQTPSGNPYFLVVDDVSVTASLFVGRAALQHRGEPRIFPNPGKADSRVWFPSAGSAWSVRVVDLQGKEHARLFSAGDEYLTLPDLQAGLYRVLVQSADGRAWNRAWIHP